MSPILVVEDSALDARLIQWFTEQAGYASVRVEDGAEALRRLEMDSFSLVLTGLLCPEVDGLDLIARVHSQYPDIPTVLLTGNNREDIAAEALRLGVTGYVPKQNIHSDLVRTLKAILESTLSSQEQTSLGAYVEDGASCYTLDNNSELVPLVVAQMRHLLSGWQWPCETELARVSVALSEALDNAMCHGNLELSSELREGDGHAWRVESTRRREQAPYRDRRIRFEGRVSSTEARFTIRDEGSGFDTSVPLNPTHPENLERCSGRGLLLMRMFMDEVIFNSAGNEVTLIKYRPAIG